MLLYGTTNKSTEQHKYSRPGCRKFCGGKQSHNAPIPPPVMRPDLHSLPMPPQEYVRNVKMVQESVKKGKDDTLYLYQFFWLLFGLLCTLSVAIFPNVYELVKSNDALESSLKSGKERQSKAMEDLAAVKSEVEGLKQKLADADKASQPTAAVASNS